MKNISLTLYTGTKFVYENLHGTKKKVGEKLVLFAKIVGEWLDLLVSIDSDVFRKYKANTQ